MSKLSLLLLETSFCLHSCIKPAGSDVTVQLYLDNGHSGQPATFMQTNHDYSWFSPTP